MDLFPLPPLVTLALLACAPQASTTQPDQPTKTSQPPAPTTPAPTTPAPTTPAPTTPEPLPGNVLIVLVDELGTDKLALYTDHPEVPSTPTLDGLAASGVTFTRAYANPVCSPTRAALLTGRRAHKTGIGAALATHGYWLQDEEVTLAEMLDAGTDGAYDSTFVGKWHLGSRDDDMPTHPNRQGWAHYSGLLISISDDNTFDGLPQSWTDWEKVTNGVVHRSSAYITTDTTDDAITRIEAMSEPWVLVVSTYAPHSPYHFPPEDLRYPGDPGTTQQIRKFNEMVESVDSELGRILAAVDATVERDTTVMVLGDNGTPEGVSEPEFPHGKLSLYEGGTRIPLIVSGPSVAEPGRESDAVVEVVDLFGTVADLAGVDLAAQGLELDTIPFTDVLTDPAAPGARAVAISESFHQSEAPYRWVKFALRDHAYRLIRTEHTEELYRLDDRFVEGLDLLSQAPLSPDAQAAYDALVAEIPSHWTDLGY